MTRKEIESIYVLEPNCFETYREEDWYKVGLKDGLSSADEHPKSPWQPMKADNLPPAGYDFVLISDEGVTKLVHNPEVISYIPQIQNYEGTCWTHWMLIPKLEEE